MECRCPPADPAPTGVTGGTKLSPRMSTQVGGTQTTPPPSPKKSTSSGATQTALL